MESAQPNSDTPKPCAGGCGFFGSAPLNFYCSVCFKKAHGEEEFKRRVNLSDSVLPASTSVALTSSGDSPDNASCPGSSGKMTPEMATAFSGKISAEIASSLSLSQPAASPVQEQSAAETTEEAVPAAAVTAKAAASGEEVLEPAPKKVATNRCFQCNKKVGLTGFGCRCGSTFCSVHRYSDKHDCPFDYKAAGREEIKTANPVINAEKVARI